MAVDYSSIMACPICKGHLVYEKKRREWICWADKLAFPLDKHENPILLVDLARQLTEDELDP